MYLRKKHLSRRTLLKGAGFGVALPFLDAMVPAATALAQTAAAPTMRAGFFYIPHGAIMNNTPHGAAMDHWMPKGSGASFELSPILSPLESYKDRVYAFTELVNAASNGSVHGLNPATWLSATRPDQSINRAAMTETIDQLIAQKIGAGTAIPSLEVCAETTVQSAAGGGFYSSTLSFSTPSSPLPMEFNPRKVFTQLFGEGDNAAQRAALIRQNASLLDMISESTKSMRTELGASDLRVLNDYLDTVREIERRVAMASSRDLSGLDLPPTPVGQLESFDDQVKLMFDLIALAYQADLTRVANYIMVSEGTNRTYNHIGVPDAFHPVSHHANDIGRMQKLVKIQTYHVQRFADFLAKLDAIQDGDGTLLDHSMFMYGSNMSNSDRHNNYPLPNILVGGPAVGLRRGGGLVELPERTPHANLLLTVLNKAGIETESFADSTGLISDV
jgi:hypothetical protein